MRMCFFVKSARITALFFVALAAGQSPANAQDDLESVRELWRAGQYQEVILRGAPIRNLPFGRMVELDYMIGTSLCRLPNAPGEGKRHLEWCLERYPLDGQIREIIKKEVEVCAASSSSPPPNIAVKISKASAGANVGVIGKMFHHLGEDHAVRNTPIEIVTPKTPAELRARISPLSAPDSAVRKISSLVGAKFSVQAFGRFVIASANPDADLPETARLLKIYEEFFSSEYGLHLPPNLITVYVLPDIPQLRDLALKLHGFKLPEASIGYSYREDMSLAAFCPNRSTGSLFHELFHLMARSTFGDIPPWLDEGMAALYSVTQNDGKRVWGVNSWRGEILRELWSWRPAIEKLVKMDWATFDKIEDEFRAEEQAANHATSCCFMQYLQDSGKLAAVFNTLRSRTPENYEDSPEADAVKILETTLQKSIGQIDRDFETWFNTAKPWPK